ncbi:uncharacterized protein LOC131639833 [Vicia villosa]|uniref:uncharacterized protein LOC131639833 n=1 Tax=Vicia villosa TaxID=3911 RepID=UPI00273B47E5|nr:uncharacterized protein LOC131639833 [Vicia villosa]
MLSPPTFSSRSKVSLWWRDLCSIGVGSVSSSTSFSWFKSSISCKLGSDLWFEFWNDSWLGNTPLRDVCPVIFGAIEDSSAKVTDHGIWQDDSWIWSFPPIHSSNGAAIAQLSSLINLLLPVQPSLSALDGYVWWRNPSGFSVSNAYDAILLGLPSSPPLNNTSMVMFECLWKTKVPSSILFFGWRIIWNRLLTKTNLFKRRVLLDINMLFCPLCRGVDEDLDHIFLLCPVSRIWWLKLYQWLRIIDGDEKISLIDQFCWMEDICKNNFSFDLGWFFCLTLCWIIWKCRNDVIFNNLVVSHFDGFNLFKSLAWDWFNAFHKGSCNLSRDDWFFDPRPFFT